MENGQNHLPIPREGENLEDYLQRLPDEVLQRFHNNPPLIHRFCYLLQEHFRDFEQREDGLENLWKIIERSNNLDNLLYFIRRLEPVRQNLIRLLSRNEEEIRRSHMFTNLTRILGSTVDIAGTVGGLWMRDSQPGYASFAFKAATTAGLFGFLSTFLEMNGMKSILNDLMRQIEYDQDMIAPIQRWYQQTEELELAMQAVFPFDVTSHIVAAFTDASNAEVAPIPLMAALIRSIAEQDFRRLRDEELIRNLINFSLHPAFQDWCEWIILRRHPVILDITRMVVQLQSSSPIRFALCQSIPALSAADQNMTSFPVWGRIVLNVGSIVDSMQSLRSTETSTIVDEISHLRRHLRAELAALQRISEFIKSRRKRKKSEFYVQY